MIKQESIDKIRERIEIVDVISDLVPLKRKGINYVALCPFHEERTPSFTVSPRKGIYKCFSCGKAGNAITFLKEYKNFTFPEAMHYLADKYHVAIEEDSRPLTEEERKEAHKRESAIYALGVVQEYYENAIQIKSRNAQMARDYAYSRWPKDFCDKFGIGFAPGDDSDLLSYLHEKSASIDILLEVGLLFLDDKEEIHSVFRNRIMIPDRDRYGSVINFTGRRLSSKESIPKYKNLKESFLYKKGAHLFGLDMARKYARNEDKVYLVEGAPDVLRLQSIGINNVVADLGTSWTDEQFLLLKRYTSNLVFIPDNDKPKDNDSFGAGVKAVMRAGAIAMRLGFKVKVKELPLNLDHNGNFVESDPDTFFKTAHDLLCLPEIDYIRWYADKLFSKVDNQSDVNERIKDVCRLLVDSGDNSYASVFLEQYPRTKNGGKSAWRQTYKELFSQSISEKKKEIPDDSAIEQPKGNPGYFISGNCYCTYGKDEEVIRWSNFIIKPFYDIFSYGQRIKLFHLINNVGIDTLVSFTADDFSSLQNFRRKLSNAGNYIWFSKIEELMRVLEEAYVSCKSAKLIDYMGFQKDQSYAFGNGIFADGVFYEADEYGMADVPEAGTCFLPAFSTMHINNDNEYVFEKSFIYNKVSVLSLNAYVKELIDVYGNNAKVGFTYIMASLFHDVIFKQHDFFPILNVVGEKGSGKSHLAMALGAFFVADPRPINLENQTLAACSLSLSQVENAVVHIDEYKNSINISKIELLKSAYDGVFRGKMRDNSLEYNKIKTGVILTGQEMPTFDIALFTRVLYLTSSKTEFTARERERFDKLSMDRKLRLSHIVGEILTLRPRFVSDYPAHYKVCLRELADKLSGAVIEDRILKNWTVILATFHCLENALEIPFTYQELFDFCVTRLLEQNSFSKQNNEVGNFWGFLYVMYQEGKIWENADFKIIVSPSVRLEGSSEPTVFVKSKRLLYLRPSRLLSLYEREGSRDTQILMSKANMKQYLFKSKGCLGKAKTRYDRMIDGRIQYEQKVNADGSITNGRRLQDEERSFVFDYDVIMDAYGIALRPEESD